MFIFATVQVVRLVSDTFNYTGFDRTLASSKKRAADRFPDTIGKHVKLGLPPKVRFLKVLNMLVLIYCQCIM